MKHWYPETANDELWILRPRVFRKPTLYKRIQAMWDIVIRFVIIILALLLCVTFAYNWEFLHDDDTDEINLNIYYAFIAGCFLFCYPMLLACTFVGGCCQEKCDERDCNGVIRCNKEYTQGIFYIKE